MPRVSPQHSVIQEAQCLLLGHRKAYKSCEMVQKSEIHILSIHTLRRRTEGWTAKMDGELTDTQLSSLTHDLTRWQRHLDLVLAHRWMTCCGRLNTMMDYSEYKIVLLK